MTFRNLSTFPVHIVWQVHRAGLPLHQENDPAPPHALGSQELSGPVDCRQSAMVPGHVQAEYRRRDSMSAIAARVQRAGYRSQGLPEWLSRSSSGAPDGCVDPRDCSPLQIQTPVSIPASMHSGWMDPNQNHLTSSLMPHPFRDAELFRLLPRNLASSGVPVTEVLRVPPRR